MKKFSLFIITLVLVFTLCGCGHKHAHSSKVVAPTCTEKGYTEYTCECGDSYRDSYVDALGHSFGEW